ITIPTSRSVIRSLFKREAHLFEKVVNDSLLLKVFELAEIILTYMLIDVQDYILIIANKEHVRDTDLGIALSDNNSRLRSDNPASVSTADLNGESFFVCAVNCCLKF